ncbi:hypothetical protein Tco_0949835 [Tanacetum coccineum]
MAHGESFRNDQYILATQVKQCFYLEDIVQDVNHKKFSNGGVIVVEDDHDVIHFDNSSDLILSTSLDDLDFAILNIDLNLDDEDLTNDDDDDDDDVAVVCSNVARGPDGDGGGDNYPPSHTIPIGCQGKGTQKPNWGGRKAGRLDTRGQTRNLGLRRIMDQ